MTEKNSQSFPAEQYIRGTGFYDTLSMKPSGSIKKRIENPDAVVAAWFLFPTLAILAVFMFYPIVYVIIMSFFHTNRIGALTEFTFLENYKYLFTEEGEFIAICIRTVVYKTMVESIPVSKTWALVPEWPQANDFIWEAIENVFQGKAAPQAALDEAAKKIDRLRKVK